MKRLILVGLTAAVLVMASCQTPHAAPQANTDSGNAAAVDSQSEEISKLSAVDTVKRFFECFNNRDADTINAIMVKGHEITLAEEESAILTLEDCTDLQAEEGAAVVEVNFVVEIDERNMTSFEEGLYTWRFYLVKDNEGLWRIDDYGM
jgi:hypothetical protein